MAFLLAVLALFAGLKVASQQPGITVMSYNIHHGADKDERNTLDSIGYYILGTKAHLVGLQEVDSVCTRSGQIDQMKRLAAITGMHYSFVRHFAYQGGAYGQGILSRYPIKKVENIRLSLLKPDSLRQSLALIVVEVDITVKGSVLFTNAHFSLDAATRLKQAEEVLQYLKKRKLPAIFMGDLNATPEQSEIRLLLSQLTLASGLDQPSFPTDAPVKTIDYIFFNSRLKGKPVHSEVPPIHHSDHLPVLSTIQF
jgi:endonuclease/exonuclease/phosphatase family metal-dependent hydrolase